MPLQIVRNDITKMHVDAIVNAANQGLRGGGGVDGCIHRAAGPELLRECETLGGCATGSAKITGAYRLPCRYVIHAVGPHWRDGKHGEETLLASCYRASLELAWQHQCETVAFPLISSGIYGYPKDQALRVAVDTISAFLFEHDMTVYLVIFDKAAYQIGSKLFQDIAQYIDDNYASAYEDDQALRLRRLQQADQYESQFLLSDGDALPKVGIKPQPRPKKQLSKARPTEIQSAEEAILSAPEAISAPLGHAAQAGSLDEALEQMDESFSAMLLRKIDERGLTDAQCYKKANIDRKLFSKIRSDNDYHPSKATALAFAIALELSLAETQELLQKAGFALSHSSKFDIIIEFFIARGNYNVFEINEALFAFDQNLLGA